MTATTSGETMRAFLELGRNIHAEWKKCGYRELALPEIACAHLTSAALEKHVSHADILEWVITSDHLPHQVDFEFGTPITVYHDSYLYIDCLSWLEGTTDIHEHSFVGAFAVLGGSSIHSRYQFDLDSQVADRVATGNVHAIHAENLKRGDVRPIHRGTASAHTLFHVDRPSVSIVVRTPSSVQYRPQYAYLYPSIAYDPQFQTPELKRCSRALALTYETAPDRFAELGATLLSKSDPLSFVRHARYLFERLPSEADCEQLLSASSNMPAELVEALRRTIPHVRRATTLAAHRGDAFASRHRYLLGLLRTAHTRETIFKLLAEKHPDVDPKAFIVEAVSEMSRLGKAKSNDASAILPFDEASLLVFDALLHGSSTGQVIERLASEYDDVQDQVGAIEELVDTLKHSTVFRPLFC